MILTFEQLAVLIAIAESITENVKWTIEGGWDKNRIIALVVGVLVCAGTGADVFVTVGVPMVVPVVGSVLTGIIAARGATIFNDLFGLIKNTRTNTSPSN